MIIVVADNPAGVVLVTMLSIPSRGEGSNITSRHFILAIRDMHQLCAFFGRLASMPLPYFRIYQKMLFSFISSLRLSD